MSEHAKNSGIFCDKCNVYIPNEASLDGHLKGKKHLRNIERIKKFECEAERSLYISGFSSCPGAIELSLADYFSKYGPIAQITVDKNNSRFAILEFSDVGSAQNVFKEREHFLGSKPIIVKPREIKLPTAKKSSNADHRNIIHSQMHPEVWKSLMNTDDVNSQFFVLQNKLSLTTDDKHLRNLICQLLESAFEEVFTSCQIQPFGSSVNGFGIQGCDLDINFKYESVNYDAAVQFLPADSDDKPDLDQNKNKTLNIKQVLSVVAQIIKQCVPDCHQVKAILSARRPVVKFHHKSSKMCCDISIGNSLAVRNTVFLRQLSDKVPYLASLVQAVRLWMKHWKLAGCTQAARSTLNNYAVTLLVLFYLYHRKLIYTLDELREKVKNLQPCVIENWDCSFSESMELLKTNGESQSLSELFSGFFHFYSKFEFGEYVLCLKSGNFEKVEDCKPANEGNSPKSTEPSKRRFKYGSLNIQDPFELNHNVAGNVGHKHMLIFTKCLRNAALACDMKLYGKKRGETENKEPWGILNLFIDHHTKKLPGASSSKKVSFNEKIDSSIKIDGGSKSCIELASLVSTILTDVFFIEFSSDSDMESEETVNSFDKLSEKATINIRKYSQPTETNEDRNIISPESRKRHHEESPVSNKRAKIAVTTPEALNLKTKAAMVFLDEALEFPLSFECMSRYRVWEGRRKARRHLVQPGMGDILDLERQISKLLVSESNTNGNTSKEMPCSIDNLANIKESIKTFFRFSLTMTECESNVLNLSFKYLPSDLKSDMRNPELDFSNFFHHLKISLPTIILKCLKVD